MGRPTRETSHGLLVGLVVLVLVSSCGSESGSAGAPPPVGGDRPVTPRAIAYVAASHTETPDTAYDASERNRRLGTRIVGAALRYGAGPGEDGDLVSVRVISGLHERIDDCDAPVNDYLTGCEETPDGVLRWQEEVQEEDPGGVQVVVDTGRAHVLVLYSGTVIDGDPRAGDLPVSVDTLFAIANDPRVDATTSQAALDGGEALSFWED